MAITRVLFVNFFQLFDFRKGHKKLCKIMCSVQHFKNGLILTISPTYSPWFFSKSAHLVLM